MEVQKTLPISSCEECFHLCYSEGNVTVCELTGDQVDKYWRAGSKLGFPPGCKMNDAKAPTGDATSPTECSDPAGHTYGFCLSRSPEGIEYPAFVYNKAHVAHWKFNHCPTCGADLRGE